MVLTSSLGAFHVRKWWLSLRGVSKDRLYKPLQSPSGWTQGTNSPPMPDFALPFTGPSLPMDIHSPHFQFGSPGHSVQPAPQEENGGVILDVALPQSTHLAPKFNGSSSSESPNSAFLPRPLPMLPVISLSIICLHSDVSVLMKASSLTPHPKTSGHTPTKTLPQALGTN